MNNFTNLAHIAILASALGWSGIASAFDFGVGTGCSAIGGVDATSLSNGDTFIGRIGSTAVSGFNKNGKPADNSDTDAFTNSVEECINDALVGYCTTVLGDDTNFISVTPGATSGKANNKQLFTVVFENIEGCGISQCSDHVDNDSDTFTDYPKDPQCRDYDDNVEDGDEDESA